MKRTKLVLAAVTLAATALAVPASASAAAPAKVAAVHEIAGLQPMGHVAHSSCGEMSPDLV